MRTRGIRTFIPPRSPNVRIEVSILFAVCETDSVAPAGPTLRYAGAAPRGEIITYSDGHFAIYSRTHSSA
ncbi:hypothetical protein [Streptomyces sp. NPDC002205]|uniref:hypothetical protein n=1 Tax=Streptomyces sp. NPDC002205 TaxID=3154411 RepID=UPI00332396CC